MTRPISGLLNALNIIDTEARTTEDIFTGSSQWVPTGRVFGGQVLAQALIAAARTTPGDRALHSMHGYFLRPGDASAPITFAVDRLHDGRSFSTRRTHAYQDGNPILSLIASFQKPDTTQVIQIPMPTDIPMPESLPSAADVLSNVDHEVARFWAEQRAFDVRHVYSPVYLEVAGEPVPHQTVWIRARGALPDDPMQHRAALAYASDYTILEPVLRANGVPWAAPGLKFASLDHAMWWHADAKADQWLLYTMESPWSGGGRGLSLGRIYSMDGTLVASVAQEGMIRIPSR